MSPCTDWKELISANRRAKRTVEQDLDGNKPSPSDFAPSDNPVIDTIRRFLYELTRIRCFRILALSVIRLLCLFASSILRGSGFVECVFTRGSYARGNFLPFLSDIDLAIVVQCRPDDNGYEVFQSLHRRLRLVRIANPFIRDVWQVIVTEREWPLVTKYAYLLGMSEWRLLSGRQPQLSTQSINQRLLLASYWNRQHYWTNLALQQALKRQNSVRSCAASLKKAQFYAAKLSGSPFFRTHPEPTSHDLFQQLSQSLVGLDKSSELLVNALSLKDAKEQPYEDAVEVDERSEKDLLLVREISRFFDIEENFDFIFRTLVFLIFIPNKKWSREEYYQALKALDKIYQATGRIGCVYSWAAVSLALFTDPIRVLYASQGQSKSRNRFLSSLLLKEQMTYEALYYAINIRVALARPDPVRALELHVSRIIKFLFFFLTGTLHRDDPPSLQHGLAQLRSLDPPLSCRLPREDPWHERSSRERADAKCLFEVASVLCERLFEVIDRSDFSRRPSEAQ
jgi:predicted nucleotidyltransferase